MTSTPQNPSLILVCGGAGYIGSHTVLELLRRKHHVLVLDNLSSGHSAALDAIEKQLLKEGVTLTTSSSEDDSSSQQRLIKELNVDILNESQLQKFFEKYSGRIKACMHFCAKIEVGESVKDPLKYYRNNVQGTMNILNMMKEHGIKKFIFSSTAAVFGLPDEVPIEADHPTNPINPYGDTKLAIEKLLYACDKAYGIRFVALRYFNAAGADESAVIGEDHHPESHLIPLILQVASGKREKIYIFGTDYNTRDGSCVRDYIHVTDLADAHIKALSYLDANGSSDVFNLGTSQGVTVREIIDACRKVTGHSIPAEESPRRPGDPDCLVASSQKALERLDWKIRYNKVEDIVRTAWKWHSTHPQGYPANESS